MRCIFAMLLVLFTAACSSAPTLDDYQTVIIEHCEARPGGAYCWRPPAHQVPTGRQAKAFDVLLRDYCRAERYQQGLFYCSFKAEDYGLSVLVNADGRAATAFKRGPFIVEEPGKPPREVRGTIRP